jgi:hypothetical protein
MSGGTLEFFLAGTSTPTNLFSDNTGTSIGATITLNAGGMPESGGNVITLFRDSAVSLKIVGKDAAGSTVFTSDGLEDGLVILSSTANSEGASLIGVEDATGFFVGSDLETILDDIGLNYLKRNGSKSGITATYTFSTGTLNMVDRPITRPLLTDYSISHFGITQTSGTVDLDIENGNSFSFVLTENATITISNPAATNSFCEINVLIQQDGAGGAYTVTWPATVRWPGGTTPVMSTSNDAIDIFTLSTHVAGSPWFGDFSQAYA